MQATSETIWNSTTSDQSLAGSHTFRILEDNITKRTIYSKTYIDKATGSLPKGPYRAKIKVKIF